MEKGSLKLFGVSIVVVEEEEEEKEREALMRKCQSTGNLLSCRSSVAGAQGSEADHGYSSDGGLDKSKRKRGGGRGNERKRGVPWTEEEHRTFLRGLETLGKGDWRGISKKFVISRTPTQVASHAQKYFLRQTNPNKKKRRSSLFDVAMDDNDRIPGSTIQMNYTQNVSNEKNPSFLSYNQFGRQALNAPLEAHGILEPPPPICQSMDSNARMWSNNVNEMAYVHSFANDRLLLPRPEISQASTPARQNICNLKWSNPTTLNPHSSTIPFISGSMKLTTNPALPHQTGSLSKDGDSPFPQSNDLMLSIGPPQPHVLTKPPPSNTAGAIRVV